MKNLIIIISILMFSMCNNLSAQSERLVTLQNTLQDTFYGVVVLCTANPELLTPETFICFTEDALIEKSVFNNRDMYRVMFLYNSKREQDEAFNHWLTLFYACTKCIKTKSQLNNIQSLFTFD